VSSNAGTVGQLSAAGAVFHGRECKEGCGNGCCGRGFLYIQYGG